MEPRESFLHGSIQVCLYPGKDAASPCCYLVCDRGEGPDCADLFMAMPGSAAALITVSVPDWNRDLTPWKAPAVFRGAPPFGDGADAYLEELIRITEEAEERAGLIPGVRALAGYSLAGLFAVYAAFRTDRFSLFGSASGSLWYPGFLDFAAKTPFAGVPKAAYFSVGDREKASKNPLMKTVEERTQDAAALFLARGVPSIFEKNHGNHFVDGPLRTAKALRWLLSENSTGRRPQ